MDNLPFKILAFKQRILRRDIEGLFFPSGISICRVSGLLLLFLFWNVLMLIREDRQRQDQPLSEDEKLV